MKFALAEWTPHEITHCIVFFFGCGGGGGGMSRLKSGRGGGLASGMILVLEHPVHVTAPHISKIPTHSQRFPTNQAQPLVPNQPQTIPTKPDKPLSPQPNQYQPVWIKQPLSPKPKQ